ncbi:uncharacterized protein [Littorina saxatilis]|uniref:ATP-grasp domain-containing protein n=1 Tax=Littorina saxatilis TaxID=31220 RepID=A0AAN9G834_9CAEN
MGKKKGTRSAFLCISRWFRGLCTLALSVLVFPLAVAVCLPCLLLAETARVLQRFGNRPGGDRKCVLILAGAKGKALHLARLFKAEGYTTVMAESEMYSFAGASFSNNVDAFHSLPTPGDNPQGYVTAVLDLVKEHNPDIFVPLDPRTVDLDIQVISLLPQSCFPLVCGASVFKELDDKSSFMAALEAAGIRSPKTQLVQSQQEAFDFLKGKAEHYVFKPVLYDNVSRTNIFPLQDLEELDRYLVDSGVSRSKPYVIQERLVGPEMSSVSLILNGEILAQSVGFSSPVHQTHNQVHCPEIETWIESFVRLYPKEIVGWITMDYMKSPLDGQYYPLECNPRLGTNFMLFTDKQGIIPRLQAAVDQARTSSGSGTPAASSDRTEQPTGIPAKSKTNASAGKTGTSAESSSCVARGTGMSPKGKAKASAGTSAKTSSQGGDKSAGIPASSQRRVIVPEHQQLYYVMNVLWVLVSSPCDLAMWREYLAIWWLGKDAVFSVWDPLPFLVLNFLQMPLLVVNYLYYNKPWNIVDYNIGTLKMI